MKKKNGIIRLGIGLSVFLAVNVLAETEMQISDQGQEEAFSAPTGSLALTLPSDPMEMLSGSDATELNEKMAQYEQGESTRLINRANMFYYYSKLDPLSMEIYDVIYQVAQDPVSEGNIGLMMTAVDPSGDEFYDAFNTAYRAICFDHPELFWLYSGEKAAIGYASEALNMNGFYFVYILMSDYYEEYDQEMEAFNAATQQFLSDIDTSISEYNTILQVHDKLLRTVNYNDPVVSRPHWGKGQDLAHTAYGALVADSNGNSCYAVCDGYSLAFEYLLQQCGIDAVFLCGWAGSDLESAGLHAWNLVKADGIWYEVDTTWNDTESMLDDYSELSLDYKYVSEALQDAAYRDAVDHAMFMISTDLISNFMPGSRYTYTTMDQMYEMTLVQDSVHKRIDNSQEDLVFDAAIIATAPIAEQSTR